MIELQNDELLALANYLDRARRHAPAPATPTLASAMEKVNAAAVDVLNEERAARRPARPEPTLFGG